MLAGTADSFSDVVPSSRKTSDGFRNDKAVLE
jgi:hypothetical protein